MEENGSIGKGRWEGTGRRRGREICGHDVIYGREKKKNLYLLLGFLLLPIYIFLFSYIYFVPDFLNIYTCIIFRINICLSDQFILSCLQDLKFSLFPSVY